MRNLRETSCLITATAIATVFVWTGKFWSAPQPVEKLRRALVIRPDDRKAAKEVLSHREKVLAECVSALRTIADLRRAFVEWNLDPDRFGKLQKVDEKWRRVVGGRLTVALGKAARSPKETVRLAVASLIEEVGPDVPALDPNDSGGFARSLTDIVIELCRDSSVVVREEALRALGNINPRPDGAVPILAATLKSDKDAGLRRTAAGSLRRTINTVKDLNRRLQIRSAEVSATFEELIKTDSQVIQAIAEGSKDKHGIHDNDADVRRICLEAVQAAGKAISDMPGAYPAGDFPPPRRKLSEEELSHIRQAYDRVARDMEGVAPLLQAVSRTGAALQEACRDTNPRVRLAAAGALEQFSHMRLRLRQRVESLPLLDNTPKPQLGKDFEHMILDSRSAMAALLEDPASELQLRRRAIDFLRNLGREAAPAVGALTAALRDRDRFVRWGAVRALSSLSPEKAERAIVGLAVLLDDPDHEVRLAVTATLRGLGSRARPALEALKAKILDPKGEPGFRVAVMHALPALGLETTASAVPLLKHALNDEDALVRRAAAQVLGEYGLVAEPAVLALRAALADDDAEVRRRASDALLSILVGSAED